MPAPARLIVVKAACQHSRFAAFARAADRVVPPGAVLVRRSLHEVSALEPGSVPAHLWIATFAGEAAARAALEQLKQPLAALNQGDAPTVLSLNAIPPDGLPDAFVPTAANVKVADSFMSPAYLLIEGSASDQTRMDAYRDIILPMMRDRSSYYLAFELGGGIEVLSGRWQEGIFAISRWPSAAFAQDFWLSGRYQTDAIPLRLGVSRFSVLLTEGS